MTIGQKIKELRKERGWSQYKLAEKAGVPRTSLASWELDRTVPKTEFILKLTRALNITVEELYQAAGYIKETKTPYRHKETPEELWRRAMLATPITLQVCEDFTLHAGEPVEPAEYVHVDRPRATGKDLYAFRVKGDCLSPEINDGDTLIVDRRSDVKSDDVVACLMDREVHIGRLKKVDEDLWLENNHGRFKLESAEIVAKVIEVNRRLK